MSTEGGISGASESVMCALGRDYGQHSMLEINVLFN